MPSTDRKLELRVQAKDIDVSTVWQPAVFQWVNKDHIVTG